MSEWRHTAKDSYRRDWGAAGGSTATAVITRLGGRWRLCIGDDDSGGDLHVPTLSEAQRLAEAFVEIRGIAIEDPRGTDGLTPDQRSMLKAARRAEHESMEWAEDEPTPDAPGAAWCADAAPLPRDLPWPERRAVTSSNIAAVGQVEDVVVVEFTNGSIYAYAGAKGGLADELVTPDSVGRQFHVVVKEADFETTRLR